MISFVRTNCETLRGRARLPLAAIGLLASLSGCSKLVPVEGVVTLDGVPVSRATIVFLTADGDAGQIQPTGSTNDDGKFFLHTKTDLGALPGKYKVFISKIRFVPRRKPQPGEKRSGDEPEQLSQRKILALEEIPVVYTKPQSTPLDVEVPKDGVTDLQLVLRRDAKTMKPPR